MLWEIDWLFGVPMMIVTTMFHVCSLVLLGYTLVIFERRRKAPRSVSFFLFICMYMANVVILLHGVESIAWAMLYVSLDAIPARRDAMLYSLNAFTAYGHESALLAPEWRLLGSLEAMNGSLIFGLTTAFLFAALSQLRPVRRA
jgi:hypothetical protein